MMIETETEVPDKTSVKPGNVALTLIREILDTARELDVRTKFCAQAVAFLKERGLSEDFEAFRAKTDA